MNALGTHLLVELRKADPKKLDDLDFIRQSLISAAHEIGVTILGDTFHRFSPQGVTGIVAIAESHISIHTWPEYCYAAVDIFTCGESFKPEKAAELLIQLLESKDSEITRVLRGALPVYAD
ncbi:MAG: S-adenosylmethionine decarboxylase [Dehalococcoidia bacterium]|nr:S-adenosylmethionine decarboxylase [Dehalococcoidia bacterium]